MPKRGIQQELNEVKWVRGHHIKDSLFHLGVFPGAEANRPEIVIRCSDEFRNNHLKPGIKASLLAEDC